MDYLKAEEEVMSGLKDGKNVKEEVKCFIQARTPDNHGSWVHSLSHFTGKLWELREIDLLKELYRVALEGVRETGDSNCADRLISSFVFGAQWDDNPADYALIATEMSWMNWEYDQDALEWFKKGKFLSEVEYLLWKVRFPKRKLTKTLPGWKEVLDYELVFELTERVVLLGGKKEDVFGALPQEYLDNQEEIRNYFK